MVKPVDLSEFSYGYAVTEQLALNTTLVAAPVFPSLKEEGQAGGGYDVRLLTAGAVPLLLQFKLSDRMARKNVQEVKRNLLSPPFYRFYLYGARRSRQHSLLLQQEANGNQVFYIAPLFHRAAELNQYYLSSTVCQRSVLFRPSDIGTLSGLADHQVSFRAGGPAFLLSDPVKLRGPLTFAAFVDHMQGTVVNRGLDHALADIARLRDSLLADVFDRRQFVGMAVMADNEQWRGASQLRQAAYLSRTFLGAALILVADRANIKMSIWLLSERVHVSWLRNRPPIDTRCTCAAVVCSGLWRVWTDR